MVNEVQQPAAAAPVPAVANRRAEGDHVQRRGVERSAERPPHTVPDGQIDAAPKRPAIIGPRRVEELFDRGFVAAEEAACQGEDVAGVAVAPEQDPSAGRNSQRRQFVDQPHRAVRPANVMVLAGPMEQANRDGRFARLSQRRLEALGELGGVVALLADQGVDELLDPSAHGLAGGGEDAFDFAEARP